MMLPPTEVIKRITGEAKEIISQGRKEEAFRILDDVYTKYGNAPIVTPDKLELLGVLALRYREANATEKEIPVLEQLCSLAQADLNRLGVMASSDDIRWTATDLFLLGRAYALKGRKTDARRVLEKAKSLFDEIAWELNIDDVVNLRKTYVGPKKK